MSAPMLIMESVGNNDTFYYASGSTTSGDIISDNAIFRIGSLTKIFTSIAVLQLIDTGAIRIDDNIETYLPVLERVHIIESERDILYPRQACHPITIRNLLLHTAGFAYDFTHSLARDLSAYRNSEYLSKCIFSLPGVQWRYSCGTEWLGRLVEIVAQPLARYFQRHIFEPLGMLNTSYAVNEEDRGRLVQTLQRQSNGELSIHKKYKHRFQNDAVGDGGLFSTGHDIIRFLQALTIHSSSENILQLSEKSYKLLTEAQLRLSEPSAKKSSMPNLSNDFSFIDTDSDSWTTAFFYKNFNNSSHSQPLLLGGGMFNTYVWLDLYNKKSGLVFSQILPFCDSQIIRMLMHRACARR